jgi:hypothetical protein
VVCLTLNELIDILSYNIFQPWPKNNLFVQDVDSDSEDDDTIPAKNDLVQKAAEYSKSIFHVKFHAQWRGTFQNNPEEQQALCKRWTTWFTSFFRLSDSVPHVSV